MSARQAMPAGLSQRGQAKGQERGREGPARGNGRQDRRRAGSRAPVPARRSEATDAMRLFPFKAKKANRSCPAQQRPCAASGCRVRRAERALRRGGVAHGRQRAEVLPQSIGGERASASRPAGARPSGCWGPTAPARPPCSTWSPAWCRPMPARSPSTAAT